MKHVLAVSLARAVEVPAIADHCDLNDPLGILASIFGRHPYRCLSHYLTNLLQGGRKDKD